MRRGIGWSSKSRVNLLDATVTAQNERGRPAVEMVGLGDLFIKLIRCSGDQDCIGQPILFYKGPKAGRVLELIFFLKGKTHDLQTPGVKFLVKAFKKRRLIVAVGAPRPPNRYDDNLTGKPRIRVGNRLPGEVGEAEGEWY
jgi:hypothetical protein